MGTAVRSRQRVLIAALAFLVVALWGSPSHATAVTPTDAVVHYVNVRENPSAQSQSVGKLNPEDRAEELESVPRWFKVRLANSTVGYVSKSWVRETDSTPTPTPTTPTPTSPTATGLAPLETVGHAVAWWFVFKLNGMAFPGCGAGATRACPFGGHVVTYTTASGNPSAFSQQFVYATSDAPTLKKGAGCLGDTTADPVGATFGEIYNGSFHFVIWNDQFYDDPPIASCTTYCDGPWGHSKGIVAWNDSGDGLVIQVTTPSWPAAGSAAHPRQSDGNTLGCVTDNNLKYSQHFFALKLTHDDLKSVLAALANASVVTDTSNPQIVSNGGPADVQTLVNALGAQSSSTTPTKVTLSTNIQLISKPSALHVPAWQMVSSLLGGTPLRVASWRNSADFGSTSSTTHIGCWDASLSSPGPVEIATTGEWNGVSIGLQQGSNHAKIGVSTSGPHAYAIFGDMNEQRSLTGNCGKSQNGRGGLFFVVEDATLAAGVTDLIHGDTAP